MEPIAALGLASNVAQFLQFASSLIQTAVEIRNSSSGCTSDVLTLDSLYGQLNDFNNKLMSKNGIVRGCVDPPSRASTIDVTSFQVLSDLCRTDCEKLLHAVAKLKVKDGTSGRWQSFRTALKAVWKKEEIKELERRLHNTQTTMTLHICTIASRSQEAHARELERLRSEGMMLDFDQSTKLDQIMTAPRLLAKNVEDIKQQNTQGTPSIQDIESLEKQFPTQPVRHARIPEAYRNTFGWASNKPREDTGNSATYIAKWLRGGDGIFWVSGKPGSGKSTFMNFIADDPRTRSILQKWSGSKRLVMASHYFWSAGTKMQKSQEGLIRTLLYAIFKQHSGFISPSCGDWRPVPGGGDENGWTLSDLQTTVRKLSTLETTSVRFCLFVDGLDEFDGDHDELCQVLKDLAESANIKICVSSRPWNVFEQAFGENLLAKLYIQDLTRNDILEYTRFRLSEHPRWPFLMIEESQSDLLIYEIEKSSSGVFLWVFLVTKLLRDGLTNRDSFSALYRRLKSFPIELEVFFKQILDSVEPFYRATM
ncbi:hypothetical protein B0H63DRAFT_528511 [Podospora didyma]|uniref:Nephrocystin 3-like N-terminal domain-containing protein n=1 Tax=Podospora didyma TaxID=330526 RepID=A0AAE0N3K5_9PEZI|nr:hypothetical protein B0H63DRAFT_528511 [Podospora didyma]